MGCKKTIVVAGLHSKLQPIIVITCGIRKINLLGISPANSYSWSAPNLIPMQVKGGNVQKILGAIGEVEAKWGALTLRWSGGPFVWYKVSTVSL